MSGQDFAGAADAQAAHQARLALAQHLQAHLAAWAPVLGGQTPLQFVGLAPAPTVAPTAG